MRIKFFALAAGAGLALFAASASAAEQTQVERVQAALDAWLAARAPVEKVTGIAAYISFGATGPAIEAFAGTVGREADAGPVDQDTLYQMGSTSKSFTAAVILQLEAAGQLSLDDPLGKWLPEYKASAVRYKNWKMYFSMVSQSPAGFVAGALPYHWTQVVNIKRDPFETSIGAHTKTLMGVGGALAGPVTALPI